MPRDYQCTSCNYITTNRSNWNKHVKSAKHQRNTEKVQTKIDDSRVHGDLLLELIRQQKEEQQRVEEQRQAELERLEQQRQQELSQLKALIDSIGSGDNDNQDDEKDKSNVVQNMESVSIGKIADAALEHLDIEILQRGIEAIAEFTAKYPLNGNVICMDRSRRKFKYVNEDGDIVIDYGGLQLSRTVFQGIQTRCTNLIDNKYEILMAEVQDAVDMAEGYRDDVWQNLKMGSDLQDLKLRMNEAANGVENDMQKTFVRKLAKLL